MWSFFLCHVHIRVNCWSRAVGKSPSWYAKCICFSKFIATVRIYRPTHTNLTRRNVPWLFQCIQNKNSYQDRNSPTGVGLVVGPSVGMVLIGRPGEGFIAYEIMACPHKGRSLILGSIRSPAW